MRGLPSILSPYRDKFDKFKNIGARMLDSIYHRANRIFGVKSQYFAVYYATF